MAPAGALRDLTLALGAAVAALGSLLFIAWKIYFRGTGTGTDWGGWWERELRELRDRDPPGDADDGPWGPSCSPSCWGRGPRSEPPLEPTRLEIAGLAAGAGAGAGWGREEQRPALHLQPDGQGAHRTHPRLQLCPALCRGAGDGPAGGGRQPEPASVLAPLPEPGTCAGVRGGLGGQVASADGAPGAARAAGRRAPSAPGRAGQQAGQERCPECSRAAGGAGPAHALRAAGALPPAHQRDLGQLEHRHQRPPCEEPAGHPALPALSPHRGQKGSHPQHGPSLGSTEQGRKWLGGSPGAQTRW
ncbi:ADP-ribosylation factor-like protein 10 isoform X1 [Grus americana]|uniref:ADP-ribosylation factor-like protein 10 isoform X1 n=1 Tax=Grus americana TaxID=9117 RepID=UPI002408011C|nr:ADP-ribosylation factor-like protein 10 isoform X1 [Grus americana]